MDISSNNQLVPYHREPRQVTPYTPPKPASNPADANRRPGPYVPAPVPRSPGSKIQAENQKPIYTSNFEMKAQETNRVGLLINIYA